MQDKMWMRLSATKR